MLLSSQSLREKVQDLMKDKNDEKTSLVNPFEADKSQILLETRAFDATPLNYATCSNTLTKVLCLIDRGETLASQQTTELFFGVTKLFQSTKDNLRRMVYLLIRTIDASETEVFIVTSTLTKDMTSNKNCYRGNAIRALSKIVDPHMAGQIERYLKTAIVDRNSFVQSAALVCCMNLHKLSPDVIKRCAYEISQAATSANPLVQYHAVALMLELRQSDIIGLKKGLDEFIAGSSKSCLAECLVIRFAAEIIKIDNDAQYRNYLLDYLEASLRHKSDMCIIEAAKAIISLIIYDKIDNKLFLCRDNVLVINALLSCMASCKPVIRFSAVRLINILAGSCPELAMKANSDLEELLLDGNKSITSLALTTLLKTGHVDCVERLVKHISSLMNDISEINKLEIIDAMEDLISTFPNKFKVIITFLSSNLREEGSYELKGRIVNVLIKAALNMPHAKELIMMHLCEFIEDCEYSALCCKVIALLGEQVSKSTNAAKYVRFIYNRLILESAVIRAAGVDALMKIGFKKPELKNDILILFESCLSDNDDEVRERANLYYRSLKKHGGYKNENIDEKSLIEVEIKNNFNENKENKETEKSCIRQEESSYIREFMDDARLKRKFSGNIDRTQYEEEKEAEISGDDKMISELTETSSGMQSAISNGESVNVIGFNAENKSDDVTIEKDIKISETISKIEPQPDKMFLIDQEIPLPQFLLDPNLDVPLDELCDALKYALDNDPSMEINFESIRKDSEYRRRRVDSTLDKETKEKAMQDIFPTREVPKIVNILDYVANKICSIISMDKLGDYQHTTALQSLTEKEAEYTVELVKHIYTSYIVLEFKVKNTVSTQTLENVGIKLTPVDVMTSSNWKIIARTEANVILYDTSEVIWIILENCADEVITANYQAYLEYMVKEQGEEFGNEDEYEIEPVIVTMGDYIAPRPMRIGEFKVQWAHLNNKGVEKTMLLPFRSIARAVKSIVESMNMATLENSECVDPTRNKHELIMSGTFVGDICVFLKISMIMDNENRCLAKASVRCDDTVVCDTIIGILVN